MGLNKIILMADGKINDIQTGNNDGRKRSQGEYGTNEVAKNDFAGTPMIATEKKDQISHEDIKKSLRMAGEEGKNYKKISEKVVERMATREGTAGKVKDVGEKD